MRCRMWSGLTLGLLVLVASCVHYDTRQPNSVPLQPSAEVKSPPPVSTEPEPAPSPSVDSPSAPVSLPKIDRRPAPMAWSRGRLSTLPKYDPGSDDRSQADLRSHDLSTLDLSASLSDLLFCDFDSRTVWPIADKLPPQFSPSAISELGKNPGLGVRLLHARGITGRGVGIAIIDQSLLVDHQEYVDRIRLYEEGKDVVGGARVASMHGAAVASIAVGKTVGVAPEADLYYLATSLCSATTIESVDFACLAASVRRILEVNRQLPAERKIRVISMSIGWRPTSKGRDVINAAVAEAKADGIMVVCSNMEDREVHGFKFQGLGRTPYADPERADSYGPGGWWAKSYFDGTRFSDRLLVPMDSRTTASLTGMDDYVFYRQGGTSWCIPYIAGLYALAVQVRPSITPDEFWAAALRTGTTIQTTDRQHSVALGPIVDPVDLIGSIEVR